MLKVESTFKIYLANLVSTVICITYSDYIPLAYVEQISSIWLTFLILSLKHFYLHFDEQSCNFSPSTRGSIVKWCGISGENHLINIFSHVYPHLYLLHVSTHDSFVHISRHFDYVLIACFWGKILTICKNEFKINSWNWKYNILGIIIFDTEKTCAFSYILKPTLTFLRV